MTPDRARPAPGTAPGTAPGRVPDAPLSEHRHFWRGVLDFLSGLGRKLTDEAASLEKNQGLRRVA